MNAVEIEEAVSLLAEAPFYAEEFPYAFLLAFGNKRPKSCGCAAGRQTSLTWVVFFRPTVFI